jgi:hypothetical protein
VLWGSAGQVDGKWTVAPRRVPLILDSLAPLSTKSNVIGTWASSSRYIGKYPSGKYYVRADHRPFLGWSAPGVPVAYFMKTGDEIPFMIMFNFRPLKLASHCSGRFIRTYDRAPLGDALSTLDLVAFVHFEAGTCLAEGPTPLFYPSAFIVNAGRYWVRKKVTRRR